MKADDRTVAFMGEFRAQREAQRAAAEALRHGGGGGTSDGMEPRIARLEAHAEHANKQLDRLVNLPADLARLQERVAHLPSKGFIVTSTSGAIALIGAIVLFADKLRALIAP